MGQLRQKDQAKELEEDQMLANRREAVCRVVHAMAHVRYEGRPI